MSKEIALPVCIDDNISLTFALKGLVHWALITIDIDSDEILQMHDQLRTIC